MFTDQFVRILHVFWAVSLCNDEVVHKAGWRPRQNIIIHANNAAMKTAFIRLMYCNHFTVTTTHQTVTIIYWPVLRLKPLMT